MLNTMKDFFKKISAVLFPALLAALGFSSCDGAPWIMRAEYGVPSCDFKFDITVVDEAGKAIKGIRVVPQGDFHIQKNGTYVQDTLYTDAEGKAGRSYEHVLPMDEFKALLEDVDGEANGGQFRKDSVIVKPERVGKGDGHWYSGTFTASATKTMKK
ncbi:MAG: hypothetical protein GX125_06030 [Bacteroidales bacterium]|jgi:putative lipoprotein (rSAM/lipoprotein system)|nr:hypothetical protein [Bacteroidales bacterium]